MKLRFLDIVIGKILNSDSKSTADRLSLSKIIVVYTILLTVAIINRISSLID